MNDKAKTGADRRVGSAGVEARTLKNGEVGSSLKILKDYLRKKNGK